MGREIELMRAAQEGSIDGLERCLTKHVAPILRRAVSVNAQDHLGYTALHYTALNGHYEACQFLLNLGANANARDSKGCSPLHLASWGGYVHVVQLLLIGKTSQSRSNFNAQTLAGETALHMAAQHGHEDVVSILLKHGADTARLNEKGQSALDLGALFGRIGVVQILLKHNPKLIDVTSESVTPLHLAARNGHHEVVVYLLEHGMDVDITRRTGTALHEAAMFGRVEVVKVLLSHNINTMLTNSKGQTALDLLDALPKSKTVAICSLLTDTTDLDSCDLPKAHVIMDYVPSVYDEKALSLRQGETVIVLEMNKTGWWKGQIGSRTGLFPHTYVELLQPDTPESDHEQPVENKYEALSLTHTSNTNTEESRRTIFRRANTNPFLSDSCADVDESIAEAAASLFFQSSHTLSSEDHLSKVDSTTPNALPGGQHAFEHDRISISSNQSTSPTTQSDIQDKHSYAIHRSPAAENTSSRNTVLLSMQDDNSKAIVEPTASKGHENADDGALSETSHTEPSKKPTHQHDHQDSKCKRIEDVGSKPQIDSHEFFLSRNGDDNTQQIVSLSLSPSCSDSSTITSNDYSSMHLATDLAGDNFVADNGLERDMQIPNDVLDSTDSSRSPPGAQLHSRNAQNDEMEVDTCENKTKHDNSSHLASNNFRDDVTVRNSSITPVTTGTSTENQAQIIHASTASILQSNVSDSQARKLVMSQYTAQYLGSKTCSIPTPEGAQNVLAKMRKTGKFLVDKPPIRLCIGGNSVNFVDADTDMVIVTHDASLVQCSICDSEDARVCMYVTSAQSETGKVKYFCHVLQLQHPKEALSCVREIMTLCSKQPEVGDVATKKHEDN